jgi:translation initiation factor RLI1
MAALADFQSTGLFIRERRNNGQILSEHVCIACVICAKNGADKIIITQRRKA